MQIIKPRFVFENEEELDQKKVLARIERAARTCYKSEDKSGPGSAPEFVRRIVQAGHESVLEHEKVSVRVVCDRGVTHEWVRHRIAAYSQESTRYCNYFRDKFGHEITVIGPFFFDRNAPRSKRKYPAAWKSNGQSPEIAEMTDGELNAFDVWLMAMLFSEWAYMSLIRDFGRTPQEARSVLPNSLKTEIVVTFNIRQWRHFFRMRTTKKAHPQMREIAIPLLREFQKRLPVLFEDIEAEG